MSKLIPVPVIAVLSECMPSIETHASLDNLFYYAAAPGEPPEESKSVKIQKWLRRVNKESEYPLAVLGRLIEGYMDLTDSEGQASSWLGGLQYPFRETLSGHPPWQK